MQLAAMVKRFQKDPAPRRRACSRSHDWAADSPSRLRVFRREQDGSARFG